MRGHDAHDLSNVTPSPVLYTLTNGRAVTDTRGIVTCTRDESVTWDVHPCGGENGSARKHGGGAGSGRIVLVVQCRRAVTAGQCAANEYRHCGAVCCK